MNIDAKVLFFLLTGGPTVFLLVVVLLFIHDPDRAEKAKALLLRPLFRAFRWGARSYMAAEVGSQATEFLRRHLSDAVPSLGQFKVKVKWVTSPSDPVLSQDGTVVLRMQDSEDQTLNTMAATRLALPRVVCPTLRSRLQRYLESAIDLALLRRLAEKLGKHARPVFQAQFLGPEVSNDSRVARLFEELVHLDEENVFVPIFLEECTLVEDALYGLGSLADVTDEIIDFLRFLLTLANRDRGQDIPLEFHRPHLNVAVLLLARTWRAEAEGVRPYVNRVDRDVKVGCDSIYIIAFPPARSFLPRILNALEGDQRLSLVKELDLARPWSFGREEQGISGIALLRTNQVFGEASFGEKIEALGVAEGDCVEGTIVDVAQDWCLVDVYGLNAFIRRTECCWSALNSCSERFSAGDQESFVVKSIDSGKQHIALTRRLPESDPWKVQPVPLVGDKVGVTVEAAKATHFIATLGDSLQVKVPFEEVSWSEKSPSDPDAIVSQRIEVVIYERSEEDRLLLGSVRRLEEDPWPEIHARFPKGMEFAAKIVEITPDLARVALSGGLTGVVPREQFRTAGYEYADHEENLVLGQVLHVVVSKVFIARRRIRLALTRNVDAHQGTSADGQSRSSPAR